MHKYFGKSGLLAASLENFRPRQGQLQMAEAIHALLSEQRTDGQEAALKLLIEAETGIGKTLAYLLPAVVSGRRIVVSYQQRQLPFRTRFWVRKSRCSNRSSMKR